MGFVVVNSLGFVIIGILAAILEKLLVAVIIGESLEEPSKHGAVGSGLNAGLSLCGFKLFQKLSGVVLRADVSLDVLIGQILVSDPVGIFLDRFDAHGNAGVLGAELTHDFVFLGAEDVGLLHEVLGDGGDVALKVDGDSVLSHGVFLL